MIGASEWRYGGLNKISHDMYTLHYLACTLNFVFIIFCLKVLKCLNQFVQNFPSLTGDDFMSNFIASYHTMDEPVL